MTAKVKKIWMDDDLYFGKALRVDFDNDRQFRLDICEPSGPEQIARSLMYMSLLIIRDKILMGEDSVKIPSNPTESQQ